MSSGKNTLKTMIKLGAAALGGLQILNMIIQAKSDEINILKEDKGSYYRWNHCDVFYKTLYCDTPDTAETVLLLHDADPASSGYEFNALAALLLDRYNVVIMDLPGCGRSEKLNMTYTNFLFVQLIHCFVKDIINEPIKMIASGLSASFAVTTAACYPECISSITMINPWSLKRLAVVPERKSQFLRLILSTPIIGTSIFNLIYAKQNVEYRLDEKTFYNPFKIKQNMIDMKYSASHTGKGRYMMLSLDGNYMNWNITRQLKNLSQPVQILYGKESDDGALIAKQYTKVNNNICVQALPGAKYQPHLECPEILNSYII